MSEGGKNFKINCPRGVKWVKKAVRGGKIEEKKLSEGGKIKLAGKTVQGGKIGQNCLGVTRKKHFRGG